eukprot:s363_g28.t1
MPRVTLCLHSLEFRVVLCILCILPQHFSEMYGAGKGYSYGGRGVFSRDPRDGPHPNDRGPRPSDRGPHPNDRGDARSRSERGERDRYRRDMRPHQDRGGGYRRPEWAQEARQERPQSAAVPPPASISVEPTIHVSGCSNETVSNIIQGVYTTKESNHGKPVYKKDGAPGSVTVLIYYWDSRDGPSFNGWWFGPKVGGDQVWAYNAGHLGRDHPGMPPTSNWKVPWDGKVDERLRITVGREGGPDRREEDRRRQERQRQEKRRREEELQREEERRREEARRRRQREEEAERRRREEDRKHEAVNNVRKVLKKLRTATPSNIKELQAELDRVAADNLKAMGDLRETVNHEMQDTLTQAQSRIQEELKQREEAQRRREAELQRVQGLVKEAAGEVDSVEAAVSEAAVRCDAASSLDAPTTPWRQVLEESCF